MKYTAPEMEMLNAEDIIMSAEEDDNTTQGGGIVTPDIGFGGDD